MKNRQMPKNNLIKISIVIIVLIFSIFLIISSLNIKLKTNKTVLSYDEEGKINYRVYLKENNDFSDPYLNEGNSYIANLIDEIISTFNYNFIANEKFDFTYDYQIRAVLSTYEVGTKDNQNPLWHKEYTLVPLTTKKLKDSNGYKINEAVPINYDTDVNSFLAGKNLTTESYLTVELLTNIDGLYEEYNEEVKDTNTLTMEIPISDGTINITTKDDVTSSEDLKGDEDGTITNKPLAAIGSILLIVSLTILIFDGFKAYRLNKEQNKYHTDIDNIIKKYNKIMLRTNKMPILKNKRVIEIANLNDLIELETELKSGILVYEKLKTNETWFILIHQNEAWIYKWKLNGDKD